MAQSWRDSLKILHIVPGTGDISNGMVVVANFIAKEQGNAKVVDLKHGLSAIDDGVEEVWVHGMWLPMEWRVCRKALRLGRRLVRMPHGSLSPVYLQRQGKWRKCLVSPIEKSLFRHSSRIVATCEVEKRWIGAYLANKCPLIEVTDIKRFFRLPNSEVGALPTDRPLHLLYLGRRHPLKGLEYLEETVRQRQIQNTSASPRLCVRIVSSAFGEEKEKVWDWCDVLVLPTLSDNFGLVIAEALERGKRVITTDGAPAWGDGNDYGGRLTYLRGYRDGSPAERLRLLKDAITALQ